MIESKAQRRRMILSTRSFLISCLYSLAWLASAKAGSTTSATTSGFSIARTASAASTTLATATTSTSATTTPTVPVSAVAAAKAAALSSAFQHQADKTLNRIAAGKLRQSLRHQIIDTEYHTPKEHVHRNFLRQTYEKVMESAGPGANTTPDTAKQEPGRPSPGSLAYAVRVGLAGGIAGATGTLALFPVDAAKTMRQASPDKFRNVRHAFGRLVRENGQWSLGRAYCGVLPATLGAIPSSALYFGAYETIKSLIRKRQVADPQKSSGRFMIHSLSAVAGNVVSSAVFVPKETIKQQMQYGGGRNAGRVVMDILQKNGLRGLYSGYSATLMRNIPSAVLRFCIYEELKHIFVLGTNNNDKKASFNWKIFLAGAAAGAISSGLMTPVDVIKTRMATGTCPIDVPSCAQHVFAESGFVGLYMGAGSRIVWSTAFAAIGFGMLETAKGWLGVSEIEQARKQSVNPQEVVPKVVQPIKMFSRHQRALEHAVSDRYE